MAGERRPASFYVLAAVFGLFVLFLYGPIATIVVLSFQGPEGGLVFPMHGVSVHWFADLFRPQSIGDIWGSFGRSWKLGLIVMVLTVVFSFLAGLAFRHRFKGATLLFYIAVASLIMPSVVVSLGIGAGFELLGIERTWYSSALGAHLTWTLPFGLLIMFAVFNRFNPAYEEAARDLGASACRRSATSCCRSCCPAWSASPCSASPCPTTSSPAPRRPSAPSTPCRSSCRRCRPTPPPR